MPTAEGFPLYFPPDARRGFESDDVTRRFGQVAGLGSGSRVLELATRGGAAALLAREFGCEVVVAETSDAAVTQLSEKMRSLGISDRVAVKKVEGLKLPFPESEFDAILATGIVLQPATTLLKELRRYLARNGRIGFLYPARVGRFPSKPALEFWEARLGETLLLPRELLQLLHRSGFEPESVETLSDLELAELYRQAEPKVDGAPTAAAFKQEIEHFRAQGRASVSYAMAIGRRREAGEKPPASRDRG